MDTAPEWKNRFPENGSRTVCENEFLLMSLLTGPHATSENQFFHVDIFFTTSPFPSSSFLHSQWRWQPWALVHRDGGSAAGGPGTCPSLIPPPPSSTTQQIRQPHHQERRRRAELAPPPSGGSPVSHLWEWRRRADPAGLGWINYPPPPSATPHHWELRQWERAAMAVGLADGCEWPWWWWWLVQQRWWARVSGQSGLGETCCLYFYFLLPNFFRVQLA